MIRALRLASFALLVGVVVSGHGTERPSAAQVSSIPLPAKVPIVNSMTSVTTTGGTLTVRGINFPTQCPATLAIYQSGQYIGSSFAASAGYTSTSFTAQTTALAAGTYDGIVTWCDGSRGAFLGLLKVSSVMTCSTIWGAAATGIYEANDTLCSGSCTSTPVGNCANGGTPTFTCDESGTGNHVTWHSATYNFPAADYLMTTTASVSLPGTSGAYGEASSFATGSSPSGFFVVVAGNPKTTGHFWDSSNNSYSLQFIGASSPYAVQTEVDVSTPYTAQAASFGAYNTPGLFYGGMTTSTISLWPNNETAITASNGAGSIPATATAFDIGSYSTAHTTSNMALDFAEICVINRTPTQTELNEYSLSANLRLGVTAPPTVTSMTVVQAGVSGAYANITGSGFESGNMSVSAGGGVGAGTVVASKTGQWIATTWPSTSAGTYNVTIVNSDQRPVTVNSLMSVQGGTPNPVQIIGPQLHVWNEAAPSNMTFSGTNVSSFLDLSGLVNTRAQNTSADQVTVTTASDSSFNNQGSATVAGTPVVYPLAAGTMAYPSAATSSWQAAVITESPSASIEYIDAVTINSVVRAVGYYSGNGDMDTFYNGVDFAPKTYGGGSSAFYVLSGTDNASSPFAFSTSVNNGTAATATGGAGSQIYAVAADALFSQTTSSGNFSGKFAFYCEFGTDPTNNAVDGAATIATELNTYVQKFGGSL